MLQLFGEWCMLVEDQPAERAHRDFVARLQQAGFLKVQGVAWCFTALTASDP